jgi:ribosomal protein S15P/S13E
MSNSRSKDYYGSEPKVKEVRKGLDKSNKHRKSLYKYSSRNDTDEYDDYEEYNTQR